MSETNLRALRREDYAHHNWTKLRPFYCRLSPEFLWTEVRRQILEELNEEIQADRSEEWEYATYFTYPNEEQMESIHKEDLFFSEIREIVGYRSAEALSLLAGLIRLEPDGDARTLLEESFANLWQKFGEHRYGHGYDTANTRADLVLMLASNNVFGLVHDRHWIDVTREYFQSERHDWSGKPLREHYPDVLRALDDAKVGTRADVDHPVVSGRFDLDNDRYDFTSLCDALYWEQGRPEEFESAPPSSIFYRLPYHMVKFCGAQHLFRSLDERPDDPFAATVVHFLNVLDLRTAIVEHIGIGRVFTLAEATDACNGDEYAASMTLGQMIKVGLVDFDTAEPWFHSSQQYFCRKEAHQIL